MVLKGDAGGIEFADSGEEEGEQSAINGESKVEFVVVGDDSVDMVVMEVMLLRWCSDCVEGCADSRGGLASVTRMRVSLCMASGEDRSSMSWVMLASTFPTTDIKDGKGADIIEPTSTGMFGYFGRRGRLLLDGAEKSDSRWAIERADEA